MIEKEIIEYNKRCVKTIGLKRGFWITQRTPLTDDKKQWWDIDGKTFLGTRVYYDKDLLFHYDWNWIHEILECIEKLPSTQVDILGKTCRISHKGIDFFNDSSKSSKKESVIESINKFLIWYDEQNK